MCGELNAFILRSSIVGYKNEPVKNQRVLVKLELELFLKKAAKKMPNLNKRKFVSKRNRKFENEFSKNDSKPSKAYWLSFIP